MDNEIEEKNLGGRPTKFTQEIADEICFRVANGESSRTICREERFPVMATLFRWLQKNIEFQKQYYQAKESMVECYAAEMTEIADDSTNDFYERELNNGNVAVVASNELVNRSRLRVDTRKWICERLMPKKYGPKTDINLGGQKNNPLIISDLHEKAKDDSSIRVD